MDGPGGVVGLPAEAAAGVSRVTAAARGGIVRVLAAQGLMGLLAVAVCWLWAGQAAGVSALVGALAYWLPNALFAARLLLGLAGGGRASPFAFFLGEAFKLVGALAVLAVFAWQAGSWLVWPALLFGLLCVLKGYVVLLVIGRLP